MEKIDNLDKKILSILSQNARIPFKDVAAECGVSRAAIHQRVQHLIDGDVIMGSGFDVNPKSLGYSTCTTTATYPRNCRSPLHDRSLHDACKAICTRQ